MPGHQDSYQKETAYIRHFAFYEKKYPDPNATKLPFWVLWNMLLLI